MRKGLIKTVSLAFVSLLLVTLTGLVGCGGQVTTASEVTIGFLGDLTGPGALAVGQVYKGLQDYFSMIEEENLIPEAKIRLVNYDTQSMYARLTVGYEWLKNRGAKLLVIISGPDQIQLADRFEEDRLPSLGLSGAAVLTGNQWNFSMMGSQQAQAEALSQLVMTKWDYQSKGRSPKIGHIGLSGFVTTMRYQDGIDGLLAANPGKFDWAGEQTVPFGTSAFAGEISKLKSCDYIIMTLYGPAVAAFVKEARQRGYQGGFLSGMEAFGGFWGQVRAVAPSESLTNCSYAHYEPDWSDSGTFIADTKVQLEKYRSGDAATLMMGTGYTAGRAWGILLGDVIERAAENVGASNVDGAAMQAALASTDINMTAQGFGNDWVTNGTNNAYAITQKAYEWSIADGHWIEASGWILAPSA